MYALSLIVITAEKIYDSDLHNLSAQTSNKYIIFIIKEMFFCAFLSLFKNYNVSYLVALRTFL